MVLHICNYCNYKSESSTNYKIHTNTIKHNKNFELYNIANKMKTEIKKEVDIQINKVNEKINKVNKNINDKIDKVDDKIDDKIDKVYDKIDKVDDKMDEKINGVKHTVNKAIIKQNNFNRSVMTILTQDYGNNPALLHIEREDFIKELELEYKSKLITKDCKLQQLIISDFKNKRLIDTIAKLILIFVKKDDLKLQSIFNTDSSRCNYATKLEKAWLSDKLGLKLRDIIITPVIEYIIDSLQPLREEVEKQLILNKKTPNGDRSDFIMNNSHYIMEVNYSLVKKRTHDQILYKISPQLQLEELNNNLELLNN